MTSSKIDYRKYSRENKGYKYILVVIDSFSRFAHTAPLKFKTAEESAAAIDAIFSKFHDLPIFFTSDKGNEGGFWIQYHFNDWNVKYSNLFKFTVKNPYIKKVLVDKYGMNVYTMSGRTKGSIVERFNRTLKERIGI